MKIFVKVKTNTKKEGVEKVGKDSYLVSVKESREKGKANKRMIKLLAKYFSKSSSFFSIVSGVYSSQKIIKIL